MEYHRFAIELFPFKKEKVPIARFLCQSTHRTFSLLPHQLIPYCQYTLAAMIQTLLRVNELQKAGYKGFYHAAPLANDVIAAVIWYGSRTKRHLFGTSSSQRSVKKS